MRNNKGSVLNYLGSYHLILWVTSLFLLFGCEADKNTSKPEVQCASGFLDCQGQCIPSNDHDHCGSCDTQCEANESCKSNGQQFVCNELPQTAADCLKSQQFCNGQCISLTDHDHCGRCENACDPELTCFFTVGEYQCQKDVEAPGDPNIVNNTPNHHSAGGCSEDECEEDEEIEEGGLAEETEFENLKLEQEQLEELNQLTQQALEQIPEECEDASNTEYKDTTITITIYIKDQGFDFSRFQLAENQEEIDALIREREAQMKPFHDAIREKVEAAGGTVLVDIIQTTMMDVEFPVCQLREIPSWEHVIGIEYSEDGDYVDNKICYSYYNSTDYVNGYDQRKAFGLNGIYQNNDYDGSDGNFKNRNSKNRIILGIIDGGLFDIKQPAFLDNNYNKKSRILAAINCKRWKYGFYTCEKFTSRAQQTHASMVSSIILGDMADNQFKTAGLEMTSHDASKISGIAPEANAIFVQGKDNMIMKIITSYLVNKKSVDVVNVSQSIRKQYCKNSKYGGLRNHLYNLTKQSNVNFVVAAGNDGRENLDCTVSSLAAFTSTIGVGATNAVKSLENLNSSTIAEYSGHGNIKVRLAGGKKVFTRFVDVVANGCRSYLPSNDGFYNYKDCGTSFSTPAISGVLALIKQMMKKRLNQRWFLSNPWYSRLILSWMADGSSSLNVPGTATTNVYQKIDDKFGFGNVRFIDLNSNDMGSIYRWAIKYRHYKANTTATFKINYFGSNSNKIKGWKFVALMDFLYYDGSPDVTFELIDKCAVNGTEVLLQAEQYAGKARMSIPPHLVSNYFNNSRCLYLRINVKHGDAKIYFMEGSYSRDRKYFENDSKNVW